MNKKQVISLLTGLVLIYTFIFQAMHVMVHHAKSVDMVAHHCCSSKSCVNNSHAFILKETKSKKCPICDFEFALYNISRKVRVEKPQLVNHKLLLIRDTESSKQDIPITTLLRAPPVI